MGTAYAMSCQSKNLRLPEMTKTSKITHTFHALFAQKKGKSTLLPLPQSLRAPPPRSPSILYCSRRKLQRKKLARNQRKTSSSSVRSGKRKKKGRTRREKKGAWCWGELLLCPRAARQVLDCVYGKSLRKLQDTPCLEMERMKRMVSVRSVNCSPKLRVF